jgi:plasmid stabilization system protein ParE
MRVRYTLEALAHLDVIHSYIEPRNPAAARRVITRIRAAVDRLGEFPKIGHRGLVAGTSEWPVKGLPYIIVYELDIEANEIVVIGVFHGAQDRDYV